MVNLSENCPFGADLQGMWNIRSFLLSKYANAQFDRGGLHSLTPEPHALDIASKIHGDTVLDICCGLGGNSIAFARHGKEVVAVDVDEERLRKAQHNAALYGVEERIKFINTSAVDFAKEAKPTDVVFLDPPWGNAPGAYKKSLLIRLENMSLNGTDLRSLVEKIECKNVVIKVPSNFDFSSLNGISDKDISEYRGLDGHHIFSGVFATKEQFLTIPYHRSL